MTPRDIHRLTVSYDHQVSADLPKMISPLKCLARSETAEACMSADK